MKKEEAKPVPFQPNKDPEIAATAPPKNEKEPAPTEIKNNAKSVPSAQKDKPKVPPLDLKQKQPVQAPPEKKPEQAKKEGEINQDRLSKFLFACQNIAKAKEQPAAAEGPKSGSNQPNQPSTIVPKIQGNKANPEKKAEPEKPSIKEAENAQTGVPPSNNLLGKLLQGSKPQGETIEASKASTA